MSIVTRFAPSPTGLLHEGHAFSALVAWGRARAAGGRFLLRLEDIDATRCRSEFADAILEDLAWLGVDWDGPVRVQSAHMADYAAALESLRARGLIYPCFCSRADILRAAIVAAPHGPDGGPPYPGTCRDLPESERRARAHETHALRLDMARALAAARTKAPAAGTPPASGGGPVSSGLTFVEEKQGIVAADPAAFGDVVLARKDTPASYHLCVTHDDAVQGVTLVTRGEDLRPATHLHRLLQALMGWPAPVYAHHALLTDASGRRLAKRDRARTVRSLRAAGVSAEALRDRLLGGQKTPRIGFGKWVS